MQVPAQAIQPSCWNPSEKFPIRQKPASFNLNEVLESLSASSRSRTCRDRQGPARCGSHRPLVMLTDYVDPEQRLVACPNQDVVYGVGVLALDISPGVIQVPTSAADFGSIRSLTCGPTALSSWARCTALHRVLLARGSEPAGRGAGEDHNRVPSLDQHRLRCPARVPGGHAPG